MDKLTDAEIVKALECCCDIIRNMCSECPSYLQKKDNDFCQEDLHRSSLDLINRQKAEIERYKGVIKILESDVAKTKVETTKKFAKYLIDNDKDGIIKTFDLPELVCDFLYPVEKVEHDSLCETETYKGAVEE